MKRRWLIPFILLLMAATLAACGGAAPTPGATSVPDTPVVNATQPQAIPTLAPEATAPPEPTQAPAATAAAFNPVTGVTATASPNAEATPAGTAAVTESRMVELEWPQQMRLGDSDIVRLALIPAQEGYVVSAEFPEHETITHTVRVRRPGGYDLAAIARLDGVGFEIAPQADQASDLPVGEAVSWHWSLTPHAAGQHRLSVSLLLRWTPQSEGAGTVSESLIYSKGLNVDVTAPLGMNTAQTAATGLIGLVLGGGLGLFAFAARTQRTLRNWWQTRAPNPNLVIEPHPGLRLQADEENLLRALFSRYGRLVVQSEFRSGYSGARTLLALPVHEDGRADAYTIAKIGDRASILREFHNYETYVKDTLPPVTARIQEPPVGVRAGKSSKAVLRYTFIGEAGHNPISLREALLVTPDPALLERLFSTFGPHWWMQRRPYTFRMAQEYDRVLPAHYVLEPAQGKGLTLDGQMGARLKVGQCVRLQGVQHCEPRADGKSFSLMWAAAPGQAPLRVRWLSTASPKGATGRVVATRESLLSDAVQACDLFGLPNPFQALPGWMDETLAGSQSTIHGDLNLENILIGPGDILWLIDFAQTRDGHTLFDFAHLETQIIAHVLARQVTAPEDYLEGLRQGAYPLLNTLHEIAGRCLSNPSQPHEYTLALCVACLGALKYTNLTPHARHLLYLTAAQLSAE
jgi:hypothetical protein